MEHEQDDDRSSTPDDSDGPPSAGKEDTSDQDLESPQSGENADDETCKVQTDEEINFQQQRENLTWEAAEKYLESYEEGEDEDITSTEKELYARQALLKGWDQKVLKKTKVLIIGLGVVGRELAKDLALIGIGELSMMDPATIDTWNHPKFLMTTPPGITPKVELIQHNLQAMNRYLKINTITSKIEEVPLSVIGEHDVVACCMNSFKSRAYVHEVCKRFDIPYIEATCLGLEGFVQAWLPTDPTVDDGINDGGKVADGSDEFFSLAFADEFGEGDHENNPAAGSIIAGIAGQELIKIAFKLQEKDIGDVQKPRYIRYDGKRGIFEMYPAMKDLLLVRDGTYELDPSLLADATIFIAGVGALGCEIAKDLALAGVGKLILVDLDTIETSNLSRQLLFRMEDIGKPKAEIGAKRVKEINPDCEVEYHFTKIQDLPLDLYENCDVIIAALDNVQARFDLNVIARRVKRPMIEGGTVGFEGHVQVIVPEGASHLEETACYRCVVPIPPPDNKLIAACTPKGIPQNREHCVLRAEWIFRKKMEREPDLEDRQDRILLAGASNKELQMLRERNPGEDFGKHFVLQDMENILKNKIPAIQTVSSVIASIESLEALKMAMLQRAETLPSTVKVMAPTYMNYNGIWGIIDQLPVVKREECPVCGSQKGIEYLQIPITPGSTIADIFISLDQIDVHLDHQKTMVTKPDTKSIVYHASIPNMSDIDRKLVDLGISAGSEVLLTPFGGKRDEDSPEPLKYQITLISVS